MSEIEYNKPNCQEFFRELKVDLGRGIKVRLDSLSAKAKECASIFNKNGDEYLDKNELWEFLDAFHKADMYGGEVDGKLSDKEIDNYLNNNVSSQFKKYSVEQKKQMLVEVYSKVLAQEIKAQIDGPSVNQRTIERLKKIGANNILEVLKEYDRISPNETLASAIDNEWGLDLKTVRKHICEPLVARAKAVGLTNITNFDAINDINVMNKEIKSLVKQIEKAIIANKNKAKNTNATKTAPSKPLEPINLNNKEKAIAQIKDLIQLEVNQKIIKEQGLKEYNVDLEYWSKIIYNVAKKNNFPAEVIATVISTESRGKFEKHSGGKNGSGPMQVTTTAIKGFFPGATGNWNDIAQIIDNNLLNDILYKNGKLRYSTPSALRDVCTKDDEYGIKVGVMIFEMKYVEAVVQVKYGLKPGSEGYYPKVKEVAQNLRSGTLVLTDGEKKKCMSQTFFIYNGNSSPHPKKSGSVQSNYKKEATDTINRSGFNFKIVPIKIKRS